MKLPKLKCDRCGKCCGPVTCTQAEFARIAEYAAANSIVAVKQGITCPYLTPDGCRVHSVRPFVCRLFGHIPAMRCANGHNVNIPAWRARQLTDEFMPPSHNFRWLHEVCYSVNELKALIDDHIMVSRKG